MSIDLFGIPNNNFFFRIFFPLGMASVLLWNVWCSLHVAPVVLKMKEKAPGRENEMVCDLIPKINKNCIPFEVVGLCILICLFLIQTDFLYYQIVLILFHYLGLFHYFSRAYASVMNFFGPFQHIFSVILLVSLVLISNLEYYYIIYFFQYKWWIPIVCRSGLALFSAVRMAFFLQSEITEFKFNVFQVIIESLVIELCLPIHLLGVWNGVATLSETVLFQFVLFCGIILSFLVRIEADEKYSETQKVIVQNVDEEYISYVGPLREYCIRNYMLATLQYTSAFSNFINKQILNGMFYCLLVQYFIQYYPSMEYTWNTIVCIASIIIIPGLFLNIGWILSESLYYPGKFSKLFSIVSGVFGVFCCFIAVEYFPHQLPLVFAEWNIDVFTFMLFVSRPIIYISLMGVPIGQYIFGFLFGWGKGWSNIIQPVILFFCCILVIDIFYPLLIYICITYYPIEYITEYWYQFYYVIVSPIIYYSIRDEWKIFKQEE